MAPTEESILRSFLLQKAGLRDVLTLAEFSTYFPPSKRSSPLIRHLYRDLQSQRSAICESVLKQINLECRFGEGLVAQRRAARESSRTAGDSEGAESQVDVQVSMSFGPLSEMLNKFSCLDKLILNSPRDLMLYYPIWRMRHKNYERIWMKFSKKLMIP
jgi:hypothetical protein